MSDRIFSKILLLTLFSRAKQTGSYRQGHADALLLALQRKLSLDLAPNFAHTHAGRGRALLRGRGFYASLPLHAPPNLSPRAD